MLNVECQGFVLVNIFSNIVIIDAHFQSQKGKIRHFFFIFFHCSAKMIKYSQTKVKKRHFSKKNIFEKPHCRKKIRKKKENKKRHCSKKKIFEKPHCRAKLRKKINISQNPLFCLSLMFLNIF